MRLDTVNSLDLRERGVGWGSFGDLISSVKSTRKITYRFLREQERVRVQGGGGGGGFFLKF